MIHEIALNGYSAVCTSCGAILHLGTKDSYGTEQLRLTPDENWEDLIITAVFTNGVSTEVTAVDGMIDVPPEACAQKTGAVPGRIIFKGVKDGVQRISTNLFYMVSDHAPADGENSIEPTPDQYAQFVAAVKADADRAEEAAARAGEATGGVTPDAVKDAVAEYLDANPVETTPIDATLTRSGQAADAKAAGDAIGDLSQLQTEAKGSLVDAINEVAQSGGGSSDSSQNPNDGEDGGYYTPEVTQPDENTMRISYTPSDENMPVVASRDITLPKGETGPQGKPGADGSPGADGKDGYSPVRGTDYWTDADIAEIKSYVDEAILGGAW